MFVPRHWSEAAQRERLSDGTQVTVRRFGWSGTSQQEADAHARRRVEDAVAVLREGGPAALEGFTKRERTVAYAGSEGLPIREEVIQEYEAEDVVVTRNSYGSLCLNTTRAMFVDVDRLEPRIVGPGCLAALLGGVVGGVAGPRWLGLPWWLAVPLGMMVFARAGSALARAWARGDLRVRDPVRFAIRRTQAWLATHPDWRVAVYETPAGARLLPVHAAFDAGDPATFEFMSFVQADPLYQRMCRLQKCFRARVSPKPWRAGISDHFRKGGTWPVTDRAKLATRARWVRTYEEAARRFAACRYVETLGDGRADPRVEEVRSIHDDLCRAKSSLELA